METKVLDLPNASARSAWLSPAQPGRRFHYGWTIAAVTFATLLVAGLIRGTSGIMVLPFETEFHWSPATISAAVGTNMIVYGLIGPFAGTLMEMISLRRVVLVALASIAAGLLLAPFMHHSWQLVGQTTLASAVTARCLERSRSTAGQLCITR
jgi:fucose permease